MNGKIYAIRRIWVVAVLICAAWQASAQQPCSPRALPDSVAFDTIVSSLPPCWQQGEGAYIGYPSVRVPPSSFQTNSRLILGFYFLSGQSQTVVLPEYEAGETLEVDFRLVSANVLYGTFPELMEVGLMEGDSMVVVCRLLPSDIGTDGWVHAALTGYGGTSTRPALRLSSRRVSAIGYAIDTLVVRAADPCPPPTAATAVATAPDTVVLRWQPHAGVTEVLHLTDPADNPESHAATYSEALDSLVVSGLEPATPHLFYLRPACVGSTGQWGRPLRVVTPCGAAPAAVPYTEDFQRFEEGERPPCWGGMATVGGSPDRKLILTQTDWLAVLPAVADRLDTLNLSLFASLASGGARCILVVGAMEDSLFVPIDTLLGFGAQEELYTVPLARYGGTSNRLALRLELLYGSNATVAVNRVRIAPASEPCTIPHGLTAESTAPDSAVVSWVADGGVAAWEVRLVPLTDTGEVLSEEVFRTVAAQPRISFGNLDPGRAYGISVRSLCATASEWGAQLVLVADCDPNTIVPYTMGFEPEETWNQAPPCWEMPPSMANGAVQLAPTPGNLQGGSQCLQMSMLSSHLPYSFVLPSFGNLDQLKLSFQVSYPFQGCSRVEVGVMEDTGFAALADYVIDSGVTLVSYSFAAYGGTAHRPALRVNAERSCYGWWLYIDNVEVSHLSGCEAVGAVVQTAASSRSVSISWTDNCLQADAWRVVVSEAELDDNALDGFPFTLATAKPCTVGGLRPNTTYHVYVQTLCGTAASGGWGHGYAVTAPCDTMCPVEVVVSSTVATNAWYGLEVELAQAGVSMGTAAGPYYADMPRSTTINVCKQMPVSLMLTGSRTYINAYYLTNMQVSVSDSWNRVLYAAQNLVGVGMATPFATFTPTCESPACPTAMGLRVAHLAPDSVVVAWDSEDDTAVWHASIGVAPYTYSPTASAVGLTGHSASFGSLAPDTRYTVAVASACDSSAEAVAYVTFQTPCQTQTVPYFEDFETTPAVPACCRMHIDGDIRYYRGYSTIEHFLTFNGTTTPGSAILELPSFGSLDSLRMSLILSASNPGQVRAETGVMEGGTFVPIDTLSVTSESMTSQWPVMTDLSSYGGTGTSPAIRITIQGSTFVMPYVNLDKVRVYRSDDCLPPTRFTAESLDDSTVALKWEPMGADTAWLVKCYGTRPNLPGAQPLAIHTVGTPADTITGLNGATTYFFTLEGLCATPTSAVSTSCHTPCAEFVRVPFFDDFESADFSATLPLCWAVVESSHSYGSSVPYAPTLTRDLSRSAGMRVMGLGFLVSTDSLCIVALPPMRRIDSLQVSLSAASQYASPQALCLGVVEDDRSFTPIDTFSVGNTYSRFTSHTNAYRGSGSRLGLLMKNTSELDNSYVYIDSVSVDWMPSCPGVHGLRVERATTDSLVLRWREAGAATRWVVEYADRPFSFGDGTAARLTVQGTPAAAIGALQHSRRYWLAVAAMCSGDEVSEPVCFSHRTECAPATLPYRESFDNYRDGEEVSCWQVTGADPSLVRATADGMGGSMCLTHSASISLNPAQGTCVVLPEMPARLDTLCISLYASTVQQSSAALPKLEVGVMEDDGTFVFVDSVPVTVGYAAHPWVVSLNAYRGSSRRPALRFSGMNSRPLRIDNVIVDTIGQCPSLAGLSVVATTGATATLIWDLYDTTSAGIELEWGREGHALGTGYSTTAQGVPTLTIGSLAATTRYEVYARLRCPGSGAGPWFGPVAFSTNICDNPTSATTRCADCAQVQGSEVFFSPAQAAYAYTLVIIDSAELAEAGASTFLGLQVVSSAPLDGVGTTRLFLKNDTVAFFASEAEAPYAPDDGGFLKVFDGAMASTESGVQTLQFDRPFEWDGRSNVVVACEQTGNSTTTLAARRATLAASESGRCKSAVFYTTPTRVSHPPQVALADMEGRCVEQRTNVYLLACNNCMEPMVVSTTATAERIGIVMRSEAAVEYHVTTARWRDDVDGILLPDSTSLRLEGLAPSTTYRIGLRAVCNSSTRSAWKVVTVSTLDLPCAAPSVPRCTEVGYRSVRVEWTPAGDEHRWQVEVYNSSFAFDTVVASAAASIGGLIADVGYEVRVRPLCGDNATYEGPWSEAAAFRTAACAAVENVEVGSVTATTAVVDWQPGNSSAWRVEYGYAGFDQGHGVGLETRERPLLIDGLEPMTVYDVYVAALCGDGLVSQWAPAQFETATGGIEGVDGGVCVRIHPNPASRLVEVEVPQAGEGPVEVSMSDMSGRTVAVEKCRLGAGGAAVALDVSALAAAPYFVKVTTPLGTAVAKLIVQ